MNHVHEIHRLYFGGNTFISILILGALIFIVYRIISASRGAPRDPRDMDRKYGIDSEDPLADAKRRAAASWEHIGRESKPDQPPPVPGSKQARPEDEFLEGAKIAYNRIKTSWAMRDMKDLRQFTTENAYEDFAGQAAQNPAAGRIDILQVNARIMESSRSGDARVATVYYDALVREGTNRRNSQAREVWRFIKNEKDPNSFWLLDGIEEVHTEPIQ